MQTPPFLVGQFAAEHSVTATMAKRALYLHGLGCQGRTVSDAAKVLGIARSSVQKLARVFIIDFADYRPYARRRDKGEQMASPIDTALSANSLPLFS